MYHVKNMGLCLADHLIKYVTLSIYNFRGLGNGDSCEVVHQIVGQFVIKPPEYIGATANLRVG